MSCYYLLKQLMPGAGFKRQLWSLGAVLLFVFNQAFAQTQLELANGSYPSAPNGLTLSSQTVNLLQNTGGSSFVSFNPAITVTAAISNQQYNNISTSRISTGKGMNFGGRVNSYGTMATQMPVYNSLNAVDNPANSQYTSNPNGPNSTGIDVVDNYGFYFYNSADELFTANASTAGRYYFGDITLTFSQPLSNPVIHIVGLGSNVLFGNTDKQGFSTELELQTGSVILSKLSGSNELDVTANKILNNAAVPGFNCGAGAACGSIKATGVNISSLTFKVYLRGDGNGSAWSHNAINAGDEFLMSVSINTPSTVSGNVFSDTNGLMDNTVNGTGTNVGGSLYINLIDNNNLVVSGIPVAANGSYSFSNVGDGNYNLVLSTIQGTQGSAAPSASLPSSWINTGEHTGSNSGNDGQPNGVLSVSVSNSNVAEANFGITQCSNLAATITANGPTTACLGIGLTLTSTAAVSYQWFRDTMAIAGATSQSFVPTVSGTYSMHIITGGGICNISSNSIAVTINYAITPSITPNDTAIICSKNNDKICPAVWGYSNYQWYKDSIAVAAPNGTSSCLYPTISGNYSLAAQNGSGCWSLQSAKVYVIMDTLCSGSVTSGGGGGVESKSLGDIISKRLYGNAVNSITEINGYATTPKFIKVSGVIVDGNNNIALKDLVPATALNTINAFVTTPSDIINFTNAIDVLSVDYTDNYNTKAVAFATKTFGEVYSHTKPICDRLKDAQLLDVRKINIDGYNVIASTLKQRTGEVEYCINFSVGVKTGRASYSLQSNWLTDDYAREDTLYNFQLWAVGYNTVIAMARDVFNNVKLHQPLVSLSGSTGDLPKIFVSTIKREKTNVELEINNQTNATAAVFKVKEKLNEDAAETSRTIHVSIQPNAKTVVKIPVNDAYEDNLYLYANNELNDLVYMSDGPWNISYNQNTTLNKFEINNGDYPVSNDEYPLYRKMSMSVNTKDYVTVYKMTRGGGIEKDFKDYKAIKFNTAAVGSASLKITLIKKSISQWENQYSYTLPVTPSETEYNIPLNRFTSKASNASIDVKDITAVNFSWENNLGGTRNITATIKQLRFTKVTDAYVAMDDNADMGIYPNPNNGKFTVNFNATEQQQVVLKVIELASGRVMATQFANAKKGLNNLKVLLNTKAINTGMYIVTLENDVQHFNPKRVLINK